MTLAAHLQPLQVEATMRPVHECVLCLTGVEPSTKQTRIEFKSDPSTRKRDVKKHDLKILPCKETWLTKRRKRISAVLDKKRAQCHVIMWKFHFFPNKASKGAIQDRLFISLHLSWRLLFHLHTKCGFLHCGDFKIFSKVRLQMLMSSSQFSISPCLIPLLKYGLIECSLPVVFSRSFFLLLLKSNYYSPVAREVSAIETSC